MFLKVYKIRLLLPLHFRQFFIYMSIFQMLPMLSKLLHMDINFKSDASCLKGVDIR